MNSKYPLTHDLFKSIYSKVPRLCVDVLIRTEDGVLLTLRKEDSWKDLWHIPGGTVYYKEKLHDAVKRVSLDELNVDVEIVKLLGYIEYFSEENERGFGYTVGVVFLCDPKSNKFVVNDQADDAKFFQVLPENIIPEQKDFIQKRLGIF